MGQVTTTMNGRTYRLTCEDGEEQRLRELSAYVESHFAKFVGDFGQVGQDRLMLMTALVLADEIFEQREHLDGAARTAASALRDAVKGAKKASKPAKPAKSVSIDSSKDRRGGASEPESEGEVDDDTDLGLQPDSKAS